MVVVKDNVLTVGYTETKKVLSLVITLGKAYKASMADGKFDWTDTMNFLPIMFEIGPAVQGFNDVQIELKMATPAETAELKAWIHEQLGGVIEDAKLDEFIQDAFAVILDLWVVIKNYFLMPKIGGTLNNADLAAGQTIKG